MRLARILAILVVGCSDDASLPVEEKTEPDFLEPDAFPVLPKANDSIDTLETLVEGELRQMGPCLLLRRPTGRSDALVLSGPGIEIMGTGADWVLRDIDAGSEATNGASIVADAKEYRTDANVQLATDDAVPSPCISFPPVEITGFKIAGPDVNGSKIAIPSPPPPPPADVDPMMRNVDDNDGLEGFPVEALIDLADPREALLLHMARTFRQKESFENRILCLSDVPSSLVERIGANVEGVREQSACRWEGPGVVSGEPPRPAVLIHAMIDCKERRCDANSGGTYGNVGAESWGFVMRRTAKGWEIRKNGMMAIS